MTTNIEYKGIKFDVEFYHQPFEKQTRDYPGCGEQVEVYEITFNGADFLEVLENDIEEIENLIIEKLHDYDV